MQEAFCDMCRKEIKYDVREISREKEVRGVEFIYTAEEAYCKECGEEVFVAKIRDKNLKQMDLAYRELKVDNNDKNNDKGKRCLD